MTTRVTRGIRNCNPLNIRIGNKWKGLKTPNTDGAFDQFVNMYFGYRAAFVTLRNYINKHKCDTVAKIINRWAPRNENNTEAYIKTVCKRTGFARDQVLQAKFDDLSKLVHAMAFVESMATPSTATLRYSWNLI